METTNKFPLGKMFLKWFVILSVALLILFAWGGAFKEDVANSLMGMLILSAFLALAFSYSIKTVRERGTHKSFRHTPFQPKTKKDRFGYAAIVLFLLGMILNNSARMGGDITMGIIGDTLAFFGLVCGIVWLILMIKEKIKK